eukprot:1892109-Rhodomonas_salina.1
MGNAKANLRNSVRAGARVLSLGPLPYPWLGGARWGGSSCLHIVVNRNPSCPGCTSLPLNLSCWGWSPSCALRGRVAASSWGPRLEISDALLLLAWDVEEKSWLAMSSGRAPDSSNNSSAGPSASRCGGAIAP